MNDAWHEEYEALRLRLLRARKPRRKYKGPNTSRAVAKMRRGPCAVCFGSTGLSGLVQVHHLAPAASGGSHSIDNLMPLCQTHHAFVHRQWGQGNSYLGPTDREALVAEVRELLGLVFLYPVPHPGPPEPPA